LFSFAHLAELIDESISDAESAEVRGCRLIPIEDAVDVVGFYLAGVGAHRIIAMIDLPFSKPGGKVDI
jgi:hypothetical protein